MSRYPLDRRLGDDGAKACNIERHDFNNESAVLSSSSIREMIRRSTRLFFLESYLRSMLAK